MNLVLFGFFGRAYQAFTVHSFSYSLFLNIYFLLTQF